MGKHQTREYALYKGEKFLDIGLAGELEKKYGLNKRTIYWRAHCKKWVERPHKGGYIVVPLEDDDDE